MSDSSRPSGEPEQIAGVGASALVGGDDSRQGLLSSLAPAPAPRTSGEIPEAAIEAGARAHHAAYEARAHNLGYKTRRESRVEWDDLSDLMKVLMYDAERASLEAAIPHLKTAGWTPPGGGSR